MEWSKGQLVYSKQGRDNGNAYVVLKKEGNFCYLADGRKRTYLKPKKKNFKHLQRTHWVSTEIEEMLLAGKIPTDVKIREFINNHRSSN